MSSTTYNLFHPQVQTQSSPVLIEEFTITKHLDFWIWIPSVFGVSAAAITIYSYKIQLEINLVKESNPELQVLT
jgi:hypothetical protein